MYSDLTVYVLVFVKCQPSVLFDIHPNGVLYSLKIHNSWNNL